MSGKFTAQQSCAARQPKRGEFWDQTDAVEWAERLAAKEKLAVDVFGLDGGLIQTLRPTPRLTFHK